MNVIAIYHHPQECGSPFIAVVSQESGEILERITIPEGYFYTGWERMEKLTKVYDFTEEFCSTRVPTPEDYIVKAWWESPGKKYRYRVTDVKVTKEDDSIIHTYTGKVYIDACEVEESFQYVQEKDTFRQGMEERGFDMSQWPVTVRMKTDYDVFLRTVINAWNQDYHIVNLIHIA